MTKSHSMNHCTCRSENGVRCRLAYLSEVTHRCSWTFCFFTWNENGDKHLTITVLLPLDRIPGGLACTVTNKDALEHMSQFVCASLDWWGHTDVTIRHDQKHALGAVAPSVRD